MTHKSLQVIRDEHAALAAMLLSMSMMVQRGPGDDPEQFFDVLRAMLFYIDEFPEKLHHPKESELLFPKVARLVPSTLQTLQPGAGPHPRRSVGARTATRTAGVGTSG